MGDTDSFSDVDDTIAAFVAQLARPAAPASEEAPLEPGDSLGDHLVIERVLGRGGMGVVYLARDRRLDREVAVKLVGGASDEAERQLEREARAMARLHHPNVLVVHEVGTWRQRLYVTMEYVDGATLRQWLLAAQHGWRAIAELLLQAARGLQAAHAAGLVHRDFKPENVLVGRDRDDAGAPERARVADFGLARRVERVTAVDGRKSDMMGMAGTLGYMAPELFSGDEPGPRADQFAFGVTCYEALCGHRPYGSIACAARSIDLRRPDRRLPAWLRRVLARCVAIDPRERFADMGEVVQALQRGLASITRRRWATAVGGTALAAAIVGVSIGAALQERPCERGDARLEAAWSEPRRASIGEHFSAASPHGAEQWTAVEQSLAGYLDDWAARRRQVCEDARIHQTIGDDQLDRRMACLDQRLVDAIALLDTLEGMESSGLHVVDGLLARLPELDSCSDSAYLQAAVRLPSDPALREDVLAIRGELARSNYLVSADAATLQMRTIEALDRRARETGHAATIAFVEIERGKLLAGLGDQQAGREVLLRGYFDARAAGDDHTGADAALFLAFIDGMHGAGIEAAELWLEHARADVRSGSAPALLESQIEVMHGQILLERGAASDAVAHLRRGVDLGVEHEARLAALAHMRGALAAGMAATGRVDEALAEFEQAIALSEQSSGPRTLAIALQLNNRGQALNAAGRASEAIPDLERALQIETEIWGEHSYQLFAPRLNLGIARAMAGEPEVAEVELERALALARAGEGRELDAALVLGALGWMRSTEKDHAAALALHEEALALQRRHLDPNNPELAVTHSHVAGELRELGRAQEAIEHVQAALRVWNAAPGVDPREADAWRELATLELADGRLDAAESAAQRVLALQGSIDVEPTVLERTHGLLAEIAAARTATRAEIVRSTDN